MSCMTSEQWEAPADALQKLEAPSELVSLPRTLSRMDVMSNKGRTENVWARPRDLVYYAWWRSDDGRVLTVQMVGSWVSLGSCARTKAVGWRVNSLR